MPETSHERYLRGEPLTPELAQLREGREPQPQAKPRTESRMHEDPDRELTRGERLDLKEWREMPGWEVFKRVVEKSIVVHEKRAISLSQDDPLAHRNELAEAWAYVKIFRRAVAELQGVVDVEVAELERTQ